MWFRSGRAKFHTCSCSGTVADHPSAAESHRARVIARPRIRRNVDQHPQRLVFSGRDVERLDERRQSVGPPVADAGRVGRLMDEVVVNPRQTHSLRA